jgi:ribose transport system substrate-binding protein
MSISQLCRGSGGLFLVGLLLFIGCSKSTTPRSERPRFAFVVNVPADRFWDLAYAGCLKAAGEENVTVEFHAPNEATPQQQKQIVEALMSRGIDGMAISPLNPESLGPVIDQAAEMFPVICQDSDAEKSKRACYIGTNNVEFGRQLGELAKEAIPDGGEVALLVGQLDVSNARERQQGIMEALDGSNLKVIGTFTDGGQLPEAKRIATDLIARNPNLAGLIGMWSYNAPQAVNALSGVPDRKVAVVGADESVETMRAIREGKEFASVAQNPFEFGYQSVKILAKLHRGEKVELPEDKIVFVDTYKITRDNLDEIERGLTEKMRLLDELKEYSK